MAWVIAVLGAALAAGGGVALWNGSGYIRLDWGQAQTVAGTVALSAGVVTIAIAAVLFKLAEALRDLARGQALAPFAAGGPARVGLEAVHLADEGEEVQAPPASARSRLAGRLARVGVPRPEPAAAEPADQVPLPVAVPVPVPMPTPMPAPVEAEPAYEPAPRAASPTASTPAPIAIPEAPRPAAAAVAEAPTVVGRYEANGASYVLFSDGTIEVETEGGTHRFASMAALKDHIERQDAV